MPVSKSLDGTKRELRQRVEGVLLENPTFWVESAYRSPAKQAELYEAFLAGKGAPANPPNTSKHETGDAVDVGCTWMDQFKRASAFRRWGLWVRYKHEPWHVELDPARGAMPNLKKIEPQIVVEALEVLKNPVVDFVPTLTGAGYYFLCRDGAVFAMGDAVFYGGRGGDDVENAPCKTMALTPSGKGYWIVGEDGGVFTFGDAQFYGSIVEHTA